VRKANWLAIALGLAFAFGLVQLFRLRFEAGDVYPEYSSLRTDPVGTQALYESFNALHGVSAARNYQPLDKIKAGGATVFYLGVNAKSLVDAERDELEQLATSGARLVIGLLPVLRLPAGTKPGGRWELEHWGVALTLAEPRRGKPANLLYFAPSKDWTVVRSASGHAIVIERAFGKGTLVLSADAFPLTNQALLFDRDANLISWYAGPNRRLIFDESHFGVTETGSVAALGRRYHLEPFLAALLLLAVLFIWKNSTPLVPARPAGKPGASAAQSWGMPYYLLRRAAPPAEVIHACLDEWRKSLSLGPRYSDDRLHRVEEIASTEHDPVKAYQAIGRALAREK
jgi:hypothetical protein